MRLVLFDIDGTLIDTAGAGRTALHRAFAQTFDPARLGDIAARTAAVRFAGMTDPAIVEALAEALGCTDELSSHRAELETRYLAALRDVMAVPDKRRRAIPGVRELVAALDRDATVTLGLVTGNIEAGARIKLEPFGFNRYFVDGGFGSDHVDRRQVARAAVGRLSRRAGVAFEPDRVTVVGDTECDVDCARANGYRAVAVATGWVSRDALETARPDAILDAFDASPATVRALVGP